jgi:hypothetical protein
MNFIVLVSDTFRYDYLGANGNAWIKTPELDAFSRTAVNFDRCTIASFPTIPTRRLVHGAVQLSVPQLAAAGPAGDSARPGAARGGIREPAHHG